MITKLENLNEDLYHPRVVNFGYKIKLLLQKRLTSVGLYNTRLEVMLDTEALEFVILVSKNGQAIARRIPITSEIKGVGKLLDKMAFGIKMDCKVL